MGFKNIKGQRFGRLLVIERAENITHTAAWVCRCDCGKEKTIRSWSIINKTRSCGCIAEEKRPLNSRTHGMRHSTEYKSWTKMRERCNKPKDISYKNYGGKGIKVCDRWQNSFENFFADMGNKPTSIHSIDRIDNTKDYSPENCRWSSRIEQNNNKSDIRIITLDGITLNLKDWCKRIRIYQSSVYRRVHRKGCTHEKP